MLKILIISLFLISPSGHPYPLECSHDLTFETKSTVVYRLTPLKMELWKNKFFKHIPKWKRLWVATIFLHGLAPFIIIDKSLSQDLYNNILHSERCHIVVGDWHP